MFLVPDGWFVKEEARDTANAIFITKESIGKDGGYKTGLSVHWLHAPKEGPISEYEKIVINVTKSNSLESWDIGDVNGYPPPFNKGYEGYFRFQTPEGSIKTKQVFLLGNESTRTLYIFEFESPTSDWKSVKSIRNTLMTHLAVSDLY